MRYTPNGYQIPAYCKFCGHPHAPGAHSKLLPKLGKNKRDVRLEEKLSPKIYSQEASAFNTFTTAEPAIGSKEFSKRQQTEWKEVENEDRKFWKEIEKHEITYRGQVNNFLYLRGGWHKEYSFSCERLDAFGGPVPSIGVKLHTRNDMRCMIHQGDTLLLKGKLKRGKPLEPNKIYNETKGTVVKF